MLILNKKYYFIVLSFALAFFCFFSLIPVSQAAGNFSSQVKTKDSSTVYFLSQKNHLKKAYINAVAYLSYGNHWSDIRVVSATYLNSWPSAKLFRVAGTAHIYYIHNQQKTLITSLADLIRFHLTGEPVLEVSKVDLVQYQTVSAVDIGLISNSSAVVDNNPPTKPKSPSSTQSKSVLKITNDLVPGANGNVLVPGTKDNLLGIFHFSAPTVATLTAITFNLAGVYNASAVDRFQVYNAQGQNYEANINWRSTDRQLIINFRPPLTLKANLPATVKVTMDLKTCHNCNNQSLDLELQQASDVQSNLVVSASWPLLGTRFSLVSAANVLGRVSAQVNKLAKNDLLVASGRRLLSKLTLSEDSGNEDVLIKNITFVNNGSANLRDWHNFSLWENGQVIARSSAVNSNGQIVFDINYLRLVKNSTLNLSVQADLITGYNSQDTYNLQVTNMTVVGQVYNLQLSPTINNINESFILG